MRLWFLAGTIAWEAFKAFDDAVYRFVSGYMSGGVTAFMKLMTFIGSGWSITALAAAIPFFVFIFKKKKYYRAALMVPLNLALGSLLNEILKQIFHRPRPDINRLVSVTDFSFPSGHAMNNIIFYGFLIYLILRFVRSRSRYTAAAILGLLIMLIGTSRVYLGVHYASDVIAGFVIGLAWLLTFIKFVKKFIMEPNDGLKERK